MNQRVMIAMAIACNPRLLIADEPTTALDVTIQAQILDLLRGLQRERGMALVLVTHNMGVVAEMARRVAVMYAGQVVEERSADALFAAPAASVHGGAARGDARAQHGRHAPRDDSRHGAGPLRPAARLPVRAALHVRDATLAAPMRPELRAVAGRPRPLPLPARRSRSATRRMRATIGQASSAAATHDERAGRRGARPDAASTPIRRGPFREPARLHAVGGVSFAIDAGPHAGRRRRIGLRQVDAGAHGRR